MSEISMPKVKLLLTALLLLGQLLLLAWEHFHGGIKTHHFLHRADFPGISNVWGIVVIPVLAWVASTQVYKRMAKSGMRMPLSALAGFTIALLLGGVLAFGFSSGYEAFTGYVFQTILLLALLLPAYRAETLLGFVLGMNVVFGSVLPTLIGLALAAISAILHLLLWPQLVRAWRWLRGRAIATGGH